MQQLVRKRPCSFMAVGSVSIARLTAIWAWRFLLRFWRAKDVLEGCSILGEGSSGDAPGDLRCARTRGVPDGRCSAATLAAWLLPSYNLLVSGTRDVFFIKTKLFSLECAFVFLTQIIAFLC